MILILKSSRTEVDQPNLGIEKYSSLSSLAIDCCGRGRNSAAIGESLVGTVAQKYIFRLQIRVDKVKIVQDCG